MKKHTNIIIIILSVVVLILLVRFVIFRDQFEKFGEGLKRIDVWQENYKKDHPGASKDEMDAAFKAGINGLDEWKNNYKKDHPGATDADADKAFNDAWSQQK